MDGFMSKKELCKLLGWSRATLDRRRADGWLKVQAVRLGPFPNSPVGFPRDRITAWVAALTA